MKKTSLNALIIIASLFVGCSKESKTNETASPTTTNSSVAMTNASAAQKPLPASTDSATATGVPPNVTTCTPPVTVIKNESGNYGAIYFGQYRVELQGYFICNQQGVAYQAALGQVPTQDFLISSGEVVEVSGANIVLRIGKSTVTFSVPKEAVFCRDYKPWNINDIKPGYVITILSKGADNRAISVRGNPMGFTIDQHLGMYSCGS